MIVSLAQRFNNRLSKLRVALSFIRKGKVPQNSSAYLHPIGQNLVTWASLPEREASSPGKAGSRLLNEADSIF